MSKANYQRTQGVPATSPQGSPPLDSPCNPAPDASGASSDACEQMAAPQTSPSPYRSATGSVLLATLPSRDQPPSDAPVDPTSGGGRAFPTLGETDLSMRLRSLPVQFSATIPSGATEGMAFQRDAAANLSGDGVRALSPAAAPSSTLPMEPQAARLGSGLEGPVRQAHSHHTHPFAAASLREPLNVGGSVSANSSGDGASPAAASSSTLPMDPQAARLGFGLEGPVRQAHSHHTHPFAASSLRELLNVEGSVSTDGSMGGSSLAPTLTADYQLPAPPPGLSFQIPPTESPSTEQITFLLESAA